MRAPTLLLTLLLCLPCSAQTPVHLGGGGSPVLLVVGPEADEALYTWEDIGRGGLARALQGKGFSVWWTGVEDLDGAVAAVTAASDGAVPWLVGHGLGGTACYRYLAAVGAGAPLAGLVTLGAPSNSPDPSPLRTAALEALAAASGPRWSRLALVDSPWPGAGPDLFAAACTNLPPERHEETLRRAREAGATTGGAAVAELTTWIGETTTLPEVAFPALVTCGERDRIAPCEDTLRIADQLGASFHKFGYMNLDRTDFGHLDLVLADEADGRVFPVVRHFLQRGALR